MIISDTPGLPFRRARPLATPAVSFFILQPLGMDRPLAFHLPSPLAPCLLDASLVLSDTPPPVHRR